MLLLLDVARANYRVNPYLHGSARWAAKRDIKAAGLLDNDGVYVGAWRDKNGKIHYLRHAGPEHVLCYAPTRSGKGVGLILPTLLSWKESVFVTDLKGELYELTAGWRHHYGHNKILRFEPAAATGSCCFNPMGELRLGTEHEVGDVQNLALLIVDPDGRGLRAGDHFQKTAYSLLVGCILHLCYKARVEGTPATFGALDRMLADSSRPIQDLWAEMLTYSHINGRNHPVVSASARDMLDRPPNEAGSVLSTAKTFLDLYRDPTVARNTSRSDFRIRDLMHYTDPVSLYIITQPNDKDRLRPLVRIVVNMIVRLLADKMEFENGRPKPAYKHKLLATPVEIAASKMAFADQIQRIKDLRDIAFIQEKFEVSREKILQRIFSIERETHRRNAIMVWNQLEQLIQEIPARLAQFEELKREFLGQQSAEETKGQAPPVADPGSFSPARLMNEDLQRRQRISPEQDQGLEQSF